MTPDRGAWIRQLHAADVLGRTLAVFREARIDVLPVKGVITGAMLYADVAERPLADVDLRVRPRDLGRVVEAGTRAGWTVASRGRAYRNVLFDVARMQVDIETSVGPPGVCALSVDAMIAHATMQTEPFGFAYLAPELHEHALLLCVNVFKDKLVDAAPHAFSDLERIARHPGFDVARFADVARRAGVVCLAWIVADWMARARAQPAWREIRDRLGARPPRRAYARLFEILVRSPKTPRVALALLARAVSDDPRRRLWALAVMAAKGVSA